MKLKCKVLTAGIAVSLLLTAVPVWAAASNTPAAKGSMSSVVIARKLLMPIL